MLWKKVSSSTFSSRFRIALGTLIFIIIFFMLENISGECLAPISRHRNYPELLWEEYYQVEENIDLLLLGSSHAYRGLNPYIFQEQLGVNTFNMGSSSQNPIDSYYILHEVFQSHSPEVVVYEVYWMIMEGEDFDFTSATYNYDYMALSWTKFKYMVSAFSYDQWLKANLLSVRYHDNWSDADTIKYNLKNKYINKLLGVPILEASLTNDEHYIGKGFVESQRIVSSEKLMKNNLFNDYAGMKLNDKKLEYFRAIINLCKKTDTTLILVTAPLPQGSIDKVPDYASIHGFFDDWAREEGLYYFDYNVISPGYLSFKDFHFKDDHHLNTTGSEVLSEHLARLLGQVMHGNLQGIETIFNPVYLNNQSVISP